MAFCLNGVRRFLSLVTSGAATRCVKYSFFITAACAHINSGSSENLEPIKFMQAGQMSHEALIKQSCTLTVNSSSQLLTQVLIAISDYGKEYRDAMAELMQLFEDSLLVINNTGSPVGDAMDDLILEQRNLIEEHRRAVTELVSLMDYVEKMVTSAAETAYLAGAEQSSTLMCERLNSVLDKVTQERKANKQIEEELLILQKSYVYRVAELAESKNSPEDSNKNLAGIEQGQKGSSDTTHDSEARKLDSRQDSEHLTFDIFDQSPDIE